MSNPPTTAIKDRLLELVRPYADHYSASDLDRDVLEWVDNILSEDDFYEKERMIYDNYIDTRFGYDI